MQKGQMTTSQFIALLKQHGRNLTKQQFRTLKGQAVHGDITGAMKGLYKLMKLDA